MLTHGHLDHMFAVTPLCRSHQAVVLGPPRRTGPCWSTRCGRWGSEIRALLARLVPGHSGFVEPDEVRELADSADHRRGRDRLPGDACARSHARFDDVPDRPDAQAPVVFSGDVLFAGSIGRTDLPGGDLAEMLESLRTKVLPLPDAVVVLPGHGPSTTMATERATNPYLRQLQEDAEAMSRPRPLSGFPEFTPEGRVVEQAVLDRLRQTFELHGFASIETRAVEPLDRLAKQGEIDKEVYAIKRLHAEPGAAAELGLHFDLTVPLARYVLENAHQLAFPFRRYQIQKVWRGERPQEGRYREFTQADIDIVDADQLAAHHDVELPLVTLEALERLHVDLGLPPMLMRVNNRQAGPGLLSRAGDRRPAGRAAPGGQDRQDRPGAGGGAAGRSEAGITREPGPGTAYAWPRSRPPTSRSSTGSATWASSIPSWTRASACWPTWCERPAATCRAGWSPTSKVARGLDYYTGTVYETELVGYESRGSIASGGRYDSLASDGRTTYPGVGLSIGVTRLLAPAARPRAGCGRPGRCPRWCWSRSRRRRPGPRRWRWPSSCAVGASPARSHRRPSGSASRSATPTAAGSPSSGSAAVRRAR